MMIVAGIVFASVMDGVVLFNRYAGLKTRQITENMRLWEGYYHLCDLTAAADSVSMQDGIVRLLRRQEPLADLLETDSLLVVRYGLRTDTLMSGISAPELAGGWEQNGTDTIRLAVRNPGEGTLTLRFPVAPPANRLLIENLREREKPYDYE